MIDESAKAIIEAIVTGNKEFGEKLDKQQNSLHELANSIDRLAITSSHTRENLEKAETRIEKELENIKTALDKSAQVIHFRIDKVQSTHTDDIKTISDEIKALTVATTSNDVKASSAYTIKEKVSATLITFISIGALAVYFKVK